MRWSAIIKSPWFPPNTQQKYYDDDNDQRDNFQMPTALQLPAVHIAPCRSASSLSLSPLPTSSLTPCTYQPAKDAGTIRQQLTPRITRQDDEIRALKEELTALNQKYTAQAEQLVRTEQTKMAMESELEELSGHLFEQANNMVRNARHDCQAMQQTIERLQAQLEQAQTQLDHEQSQLRELRARFESDPPMPCFAQKEMKGFMFDNYQVEQFRKFLIRVRTMPLPDVHRLPLVKQCLHEDVGPCLGPLKSKIALSKMVDCLVQQTCFIDRRYSHHANQAGSATCFACSRPSMFHFRLREHDKPWSIDRRCRDRLVTVCDFYAFIRNVHDGRYASRPVEDLFWELTRARLSMFWARSGVLIDKDLPSVPMPKSSEIEDRTE